MKRLFFLAVLLGTMVLTGIFAFSYWRLKSKTPESYFEVGKKHYDQGQLSDAQIEFLNALRLDPGHRNSRYYLALSYFDQQDVSTAFKQLKILLDGHPDDVEGNLKLGALYIAAGASNPKLYDEAIATADTVLNKDSKNVDALILKGNAQAAQQNFDEALQTLGRATELEPKNVGAWIMVGKARVWQKNFPEAEKAFLTAREAGPKDPRAFTSLASFYRVVGKPDKAELVFTEALSQFPGDPQVYTEVTNFYLSAGRVEDAERVLKAAQAANTKDPAPTLTLAEVYRSKNRNADAVGLLRDAKTRFPESIPLAAKLAGFLIAEKKPDQARVEIDQILKANQNDPEGLLLLAELEFSAEKFDKAAAALGKNPAVSRTYPHAQYLLGNLALNNGKFDEAQDHYQQAVALGRAYQNKPYLPALIALSNGYLTKGNTVDARLQVRQILEVDPSNVQGRLLKAVIDGLEKKDSAAEAEFAGLLKDDANDPELHRLMGVYWFPRNKTTAEKSFTRALELESSEQNVRNLAFLYMATNQRSLAKEKLSAVPDAEKKAIHYELLGMLAEEDAKPQEAEVAYKKALEMEVGRTSTEQRLFDLYLRNRRYDEATRRLDDLAKRAPSDAMVFAMKGALAMREVREGQLDKSKEKEKEKEAEDNYRKAIELNPTLDLAANNLAYLLAEDGRDLQTAETLAQGVRNRQPQNAASADTLGWVHFKQGRLILARDQLLFAVSTSKEPDNGIFYYHLGKIYKEQGEKAKAIIALKKAAEMLTEKDKEKQLAAADLRELQTAPSNTKPQ